MKNNKGITLIALVVTIIVLLILAGVSIAMLSGENGILGRATESSWKTELSNVQDTVNVSIANYLTDYYAVKYSGATSTLLASGQSYTDADDAITKACQAAATSTGAIVTPALTATPATITISIDSNAYSVVGTVSGGVVTWGTMTKN